MARHGTMPEIIYRRHLHISERDWFIVFGVAARMASEEERLEDMPDSYRDTDDSDDEVIEYDTSSDEEETETRLFQN